MEKKIESFSGDYRFLSNFWPAEVMFQNIKFPSVEHAYQAAKSKDGDVWLEFSTLPTAGVAKRFGRNIEIREDWNSIRLNVMFKLLEQKFAHPELKELLLATSGCELIEGNNWGDTFWGVCKGEGKNHLGRMLMSIRDSIEFFGG